MMRGRGEEAVACRAGSGRVGGQERNCPGRFEYCNYCFWMRQILL